MSLEHATESALMVAEFAAQRSKPTEATPARERLSPLTPREQEVAVLIARGLRNRPIATALMITEGTVENHVQHILNRLGFSSRAQIAAWAVEYGLAKSAFRTE